MLQEVNLVSHPCLTYLDYSHNPIQHTFHVQRQVSIGESGLRDSGISPGIALKIREFITGSWERENREPLYSSVWQGTQRESRIIQTNGDVARNFIGFDKCDVETGTALEIEGRSRQSSNFQCFIRSDTLDVVRALVVVRWFGVAGGVREVARTANPIIRVEGYNVLVSPPLSDRWSEVDSSEDVFCVAVLKSDRKMFVVWDIAENAGVYLHSSAYVPQVSSVVLTPSPVLAQRMPANNSLSITNYTPTFQRFSQPVQSSYAVRSTNVSTPIYQYQWQLPQQQLQQQQQQPQIMKPETLYNYPSPTREILKPVQSYNIPDPMMGLTTEMIREKTPQQKQKKSKRKQVRRATRRAQLRRRSDVNDRYTNDAQNIEKPSNYTPERNVGNDYKKVIPVFEDEDEDDEYFEILSSSIDNIHRKNYKSGVLQSGVYWVNNDGYRDSSFRKEEYEQQKEQDVMIIGAKLPSKPLHWVEKGRSLSSSRDIYKQKERKEEAMSRSFSSSSAKKNNVHRDDFLVQKKMTRPQKIEKTVKYGCGHNNDEINDISMNSGSEDSIGNYEKDYNKVSSSEEDLSYQSHQYKFKRISNITRDTRPTTIPKAKNIEQTEQVPPKTEKQRRIPDEVLINARSETIRDFGEEKFVDQVSQEQVVTTNKTTLELNSPEPERKSYVGERVQNVRSIEEIGENPQLPEIKLSEDGKAQELSEVEEPISEQKGMLYNKDQKDQHTFYEKDNNIKDNDVWLDEFQFVDINENNTYILIEADELDLDKQSLTMSINSEYDLSNIICVWYLRNPIDLDNNNINSAQDGEFTYNRQWKNTKNSKIRKENEKIVSNIANIQKYMKLLKTKFIDPLYQYNNKSSSKKERNIETQNNERMKKNYSNSRLELINYATMSDGTMRQYVNYIDNDFSRTNTIEVRKGSDKKRSSNFDINKTLSPLELLTLFLKKVSEFDEDKIRSIRTGSGYSGYNDTEMNKYTDPSDKIIGIYKKIMETIENSRYLSIWGFGRTIEQEINVKDKNEIEKSLDNILNINNLLKSYDTIEENGRHIMATIGNLFAPACLAIQISDDFTSFKISDITKIKYLESRTQTNIPSIGGSTRIDKNVVMGSDLKIESDDFCHDISAQCLPILYGNIDAIYVSSSNELFKDAIEYVDGKNTIVAHNYSLNIIKDIQSDDSGERKKGGKYNGEDTDSEEQEEEVVLEETSQSEMNEREIKNLLENINTISNKTLESKENSNVVDEKKVEGVENNPDMFEDNSILMRIREEQQATDNGLYLKSILKLEDIQQKNY